MDELKKNVTSSAARRRLLFWYGILMLVMGLIIARLFYLQVVRYDHYRQAALSGQLKQYEIEPTRGTIAFKDRDATVPVVLNETLYTLFADPVYVDDAAEVADKLVPIIGKGSSYGDVKSKMETKQTRYVVLAKRLTKQQSDAVAKLELKGIGTREQSYRTYPQGVLGAQLLGFVDEEGAGRYGIEQSMNKAIEGKPGLLKAITDAAGVPLVSNKDNVEIVATPGADIVLTVDVGLQQQVEDLLKQGLDAAKSKSGSIVIMDPTSGAVKATANYPSFNPAAYADQADISAFSNAAFSSPLEPGSVIKPFTAAAALEQGVVTMNSSYYDPSFYKIDDATVRNIEEDGGPGTKNLSDILQLSLNTGATWLLQQMGGGDLNLKGRSAWHDYMVNHYRFGQLTGIESYETEGIIPDPAKGDGLNIQYANTSFGQGMTVTPLQLAGALSALINGGTYYQPYMVESVTHPDGTKEVKKPKILRQNVISSSVSDQMRGLMQYVVDKNNRPAARAGFQVGGKTGTAQIPKPTGGYYEDKYNGMYVGFVGGDQPQYAIVVRVNEPGIAGYAGSRAAGPIFTSVSNLLINNFGVTPKTQP